MNNEKVVLPGDSTHDENYLNENSNDANVSQGISHIRPTFKIASVKTRLPIPPFKSTYLGSSCTYFPRVGDVVVGIVVHTHSEGYKVDINSPFDAQLGLTAFNNTTKINRPRLEVGSIVVARVLWSGVDILEDHSKPPHKNTLSSSIPSLCFHCLSVTDGCEITCETPDDPRSWSAGTYLGELSRNQGYMFDVPIAFAISLLSDDCYILDRLGELGVKYEISVGHNGRIWVMGASIQETIFVVNILRSVIGLDLPKIEYLMRSSLQKSNINSSLS